MSSYREGLARRNLMIPQDKHNSLLRPNEQGCAMHIVRCHKSGEKSLSIVVSVLAYKTARRGSRFGFSASPAGIASAACLQPFFQISITPFLQHSRTSFACPPCRGRTCRAVRSVLY